MTVELTENQERWLQALESGEYRQATQVLRTKTDEFCCLGVGCNLIGLAIDPSEDGDYYYFIYEDEYGEKHTEEAEAPAPLRAWLGLRDSAGTPSMLGASPLTDEEVERIENEFPSFVELNDEGFTFAEIAAIVRRNPEAWFTQP